VPRANLFVVCVHNKAISWKIFLVVAAAAAATATATTNSNNSREKIKRSPRRPQMKRVNDQMTEPARSR